MLSNAGVDAADLHMHLQFRVILREREKKMQHWREKNLWVVFTRLTGCTVIKLCEIFLFSLINWLTFFIISFLMRQTLQSSWTLQAGVIVVPFFKPEVRAVGFFLFVKAVVLLSFLPYEPLDQVFTTVCCGRVPYRYRTEYSVPPFSTQHTLSFSVSSIFWQHFSRLKSDSHLSDSTAKAPLHWRVPPPEVRWEEVPSKAGAYENVSKHFWKTELPSSEVIAAAVLSDEQWPRKREEGWESASRWQIPVCQRQWSGLFTEEASLRGSSRFCPVPYSLYSVYPAAHCLITFSKVGAIITNLLTTPSFTNHRLHRTCIPWFTTSSIVLTLLGDGWLTTDWI